MDTKVDTTEANEHNQEQDAPHDNLLPSTVAHCLVQEDEKHSVKRSGRQGVATREAMTGLEERTNCQVVVRPWTGDDKLRPSLKQGNTEGVEDDEEE